MDQDNSWYPINVNTFVFSYVNSSEILSIHSFMGMGISLPCMSMHTYLPSACRGQKRTLSPPELKIRGVVSHNVILGNESWVLWKDS